RRQRPARQGDAPLGEPPRQHRPCPYQPPCNCPFRTAEVSSGILTGLAFQIAEDDGDAILVGQATQLLVEQGEQVVPAVWFGHGWFWQLGHLPLSRLSLGGCCPRLERRLVGHAVEPAGKQLG